MAADRAVGDVSSEPARRQVLGYLALGAAGLGLSACTRSSPAPPEPGTGFVGPTDPVVVDVEAARHGTGVVQRFSVTTKPATIDLGGPLARTWCYGDTTPGPTWRVAAGQRMQVDLRNALPEDTTIHWHGLRLRNDMDGVPGVTQDPVAPGASFTYRFTVPDPGTYFFHSHVGLQLDRGMTGILLVDDPDEPGRYDQDWVLVLDDWLDGVDGSPESTLDRLRSSAGGMGGGGMGAMMGGGLDIDYPHYLVNGRVPAAAVTLEAKPAQRVRIRIINSAADTTFRCALGEHRMRLTHKDGIPTAVVETDALVISMGERYDVEVTLADGAFPFVAVPEGKPGYARAILRTSEGAAAPSDNTLPAELTRQILVGTEVPGPAQTPGYDLGSADVDHELDITLGVRRSGYVWLLNDTTFARSQPYPIERGQRVRLTMTNRSHALHPMHLHGHSFRLASSGSWQDTVLLGSMSRTSVEFVADNPGMWAVHCHNIYHAEAGMMALVGYQL